MNFSRSLINLPEYIIIKTVGYLHIAHTVFYITYPLWSQNVFRDLIYIDYSFFVFFTYTFYNGECPISYFCHALEDDKYISGTSIGHCVDIEYALGSKELTVYYLNTMNTFCILALFFVINRNAIIDKNVMFYTFSTAYFYSLFICKFFNKKMYGKYLQYYFPLFQEFAKYIFAVGMVYISYLIDHQDTSTMGDKPLLHFTKMLLTSAMLNSISKSTFTREIG